MKLLVLGLLLLQLGPRAPLTPAETLLAPAILNSIREAPAGARPVPSITGTDGKADILLTCREGQCATAMRAATALNGLVASKTIPQPLRSIRVVTAVSPEAARAIAAIHIAEVQGRPLQILRGLWSQASIADEVVEIFSRQDGIVVDARSYERVGQLPLETYAVPTTTIVVNPSVSNDHAAFVAAASAYFLATLPNDGSEALLSHLTVGAHARLAEDGRKAVALMGTQQRASGEVLTMFANAIDREQRRMRSLERFMPSPVDPILHDRIVDMTKGITGVWSTMGITPSPFVPPADRIRGRGGEDRRVPVRPASTTVMPAIELPTAFLKFDNVETIVYELGNFVDGQRSISDIRDAVSAEFSPIALPVVAEYFDRLAKAGAITVK